MQTVSPRRFIGLRSKSTNRILHALTWFSPDTDISKNLIHNVEAAVLLFVLFPELTFEKCYMNVIIRLLWSPGFFLSLFKLFFKKKISITI